MAVASSVKSPGIGKSAVFPKFGVEDFGVQDDECMENENENENEGIEDDDDGGGGGGGGEGPGDQGQCAETSSPRGYMSTNKYLPSVERLMEAIPASGILTHR